MATSATPASSGSSAAGGKAAGQADSSKPSSSGPVNTEAPAPTPPTVGGWVHYRLSTHDVGEINRRRRRSAAAPANEWGFIAPRGNPVHTGDVCAALVVAVFGSGSSVANLRVVLDGTDELWVTSRSLGDDDGQWSWPARV